jgi:hypothetical protein
VSLNRANADISHTMQLKELVAAADDSILYIRPDILRFKLLDYHLLPDIVEAGATAARLVIDRAESRAREKSQRAARRAAVRSFRTQGFIRDALSSRGEGEDTVVSGGSSVVHSVADNAGEHRLQKSPPHELPASSSESMDGVEGAPSPLTFSHAKAASVGARSVSTGSATSKRGSKTASGSTMTDVPSLSSIPRAASAPRSSPAASIVSQADASCADESRAGSGVPAASPASVPPSASGLFTIGD